MDRHAAAQQRVDTAARGVAQQTVAAVSSDDFPFRVGTVTATSPLTVTFPGESGLTGFARLAGYTPTIGDVVLVLVRAPVATIIDKFA